MANFVVKCYLPTQIRKEKEHDEKGVKNENYQ